MPPRIPAATRKVRLLDSSGGGASKFDISSAFMRNSPHGLGPSVLRHAGALQAVAQKIPMQRLSHNLQIDQWDEQLLPILKPHFGPRRPQAAREGALPGGQRENRADQGSRGLSPNSNRLPRREDDHILRFGWPTLRRKRNYDLGPPARS